MSPNDSDSVYINLFRQALRIRLVEEKIIEIYNTDLIQSPVHLSIGQEAVAVGICASLSPGDKLFGSYRSHAFYMAMGGNLRRMFAELYGRATGDAKGKAGSMHLTAPEVGFMGSSAIVASTIPHAVGAALAAKQRRTGQVLVTVFGDGATEEGVFHESMNFAALHRLPVLFICENNGYAVHSHISARQSYRIGSLAACYGIPVHTIPQGFDFQAVSQALGPIVQSVRNGDGPAFVEIATCRYREHVGPGDDLHVGYRDEATVRAWQANDPLCTAQELVQQLAPALQEEIADAMAFAANSPWPTQEELLTDVL